MDWVGRDSGNDMIFPGGFNSLRALRLRSLLFELRGMRDSPEQVAADLRRLL